MTDVRLGDCRDVMREIADGSVSACITDPPYHLTQASRGGSARTAGTGPFGRHRVGEKGFMGKTWDGGGVAFTVELWQEVLRVLCAGSYLLAFGGTRTYHRLACAIEDAGFEVQDCLSWLYGSGFPKHKSKLKPAWEPIVLARKPAERATPLNIDACRLPCEPFTFSRGATALGVMNDDGWQPKPQSGENHPLGRWPANVLLDEEAARALDAETGECGNHGGAGEYASRSMFGGGIVTSAPNDSGGASRFFYTSKASKAERWEYLSCDCEAARLRAWESEDRSRSAPTECTLPGRATFAGSSTDESSLLTLPLGNEFTGESRVDSKSITSTRTSKTTGSITSDSSVPPNTSESTAAANCAVTDGGSHAASAASSSPSTPSTGISPAKAGRSTGVAVPATSRRSSATSNCADCGKPLKRTGHPTVKPVDLMRWLVRLVTPPNGLVLDPFTGSGTTGVAAVLEERRFLGIEREPEYVEIAERRIGRAAEQGSLFRDVDVA